MTRRGWAVVVLGLLGVAVVAGPASAGPVWRRHPLVAPRVAAAGVCTGVLVVRHDAVELGPGMTWLWRPDDGRATVEVRASIGGDWTPVRTVSGGERTARWPGWAQAAYRGARFDQVRVVVDGYRSPPALIGGECVT